MHHVRFNLCLPDAVSEGEVGQHSHAFGDVGDRSKKRSQLRFAKQAQWPAIGGAGVQIMSDVVMAPRQHAVDVTLAPRGVERFNDDASRVLIEVVHVPCDLTETTPISAARRTKTI